MKIAYKVVVTEDRYNDHPELKRVRNRQRNGRFTRTPAKFFSVLNNQDGFNRDCYETSYLKGEVTRAPIGKLFVFGEMPTATQVRRITSEPVHIFRCAVDDLIPTDYCSFCSSRWDVERFWKAWDEGRVASCVSSQQAIPGTMFANEVVLLEDVTPDWGKARA